MQIDFTESCKNFVKVTFLLKSWFHDIFFGEREILVFPHCGVGKRLVNYWTVMCPNISWKRPSKWHEIVHKFRKIFRMLGLGNWRWCLWWCKQYWAMWFWWFRLLRWNKFLPIQFLCILWLSFGNMIYEIHWV